MKISVTAGTRQEINKKSENKMRKAKVAFGDADMKIVEMLSREMKPHKIIEFHLILIKRNIKWIKMDRGWRFGTI